MRVLVIDDNQAVTQLLADVLEMDQHHVVVAQGGRAGLAALESSPFDVIFLDLWMPDLDGIRIYERLSAARPDLAEKVVFITGDAVNPITQDFLHSTGRPFICKPFDIMKITDLVLHVAA